MTGHLNSGKQINKCLIYNLLRFRTLIIHEFDKQLHLRLRKPVLAYQTESKRTWSLRGKMFIRSLRITLGIEVLAVETGIEVHRSDVAFRDKNNKQASESLYLEVLVVPWTSIHGLWCYTQIMFLIYFDKLTDLKIKC